MRNYPRWLRPDRHAIVVLFTLAVMTTGLQMIQPLFMRFIVDRILLVDAGAAAVQSQMLNLTGMAFLSVVALGAGLGALRCPG